MVTPLTFVWRIRIWKFSTPSQIRLCQWKGNNICLFILEHVSAINGSRIIHKLLYIPGYTWRVAILEAPYFIVTAVVWCRLYLHNSSFLYPQPTHKRSSVFLFWYCQTIAIPSHSTQPPPPSPVLIPTSSRRRTTFQRWNAVFIVPNHSGAGNLTKIFFLLFRYQALNAWNT